MRIVVQLIENYLKQDIPTILISTDNNKYLFNVPSSFQRFTKDHRIGMPTGAYYFFTKSNTAAITGLTGLLLTLFERGGSCKTKLYLDEKLFQYMQELRYKMGYKGAPISYCDWSGRTRKGINNFRAIQQLIRRQNFADIFNNLNDFITNHLKIEQQNDASVYYNPVSRVFQNEDLKISHFQILDRGEYVTNYIIEPGPLPGKILVDKLKQFGIKGKAIAQIQKVGFLSINGKTVKYQQVKQPDTPSPNVIILHYSTLQSIHNILHHEVLQQYLHNQKNFTFNIIHIVEDSDIIQSPSFKQLLSHFDSSVQHTVYNRKYRNSKDSLQQLVNLTSQVQLISNLHKHFPLCMPDLQTLQFNYLKKFIGNTESIDLKFPQQKIRAYRRCEQLIIAPKKSWGFKQIKVDDKKQEFNQIQHIDYSTISLSEQLKQKFKLIDPKIIFLGTGSMKPSRYRNVSSILVEITPENLIMLDCGEGSHIQMAQHYGFEKLEQMLIKLRTIFITHIHSDHNLGILDLISQRNAIIRKSKLPFQSHKLFLVIPSNVTPWFHSFSKNIQNLLQGCQIVFSQSLRGEAANFEGTMSKQDRIEHQLKLAANCPLKLSKSEMVDQSAQDEQQDEQQLSLTKPEWEEVINIYDKNQPKVLALFDNYLKSIGIVQFQPCPVIHCPQSYGIVITHSTGIKISYSGDTRPCIQFSKAAANSTVLIHQATFGDDLSANAVSHYHSTVGQAIDIGMASKSWKTALTHFSQRYQSASDIVQPKMYKLNKVKQQYAEKHTIVCFDHFQMNLSQAHIMPYYSRALSNAIPKDSKE